MTHNTVYEHRVVLACNGVQREYNVAWPSTSIDATARNVKAPTPKTLEPASLKRDGADGKKCACMIHVSGTLGGKFSRRQTGTADWDEAKSVVALLQQSGSWDGQDKIEAPLTLPDTNPEPERISVIRAIAAFTAEFEEHTAPNTQRNYKFVLKQLRGFSDAKGHAAIDQWTPIDVREFRASWGVLPSTVAKNMSVVKAFFEFCHANEWTPRNPARMVKNQRSQHNDPRSEQKLPFSDEELKRMYDACDTKYGKREIQFSKATKERKEQGPYAQYRTRWTFDAPAESRDKNEDRDRETEKSENDAGQGKEGFVWHNSKGID